MSTTGKFITVEGSEGAGKTTALAFIRQYIASAGVDAVYTREPGGTELSETLRDILLDTRFKGMAESTELLTMFAARAEHIDKVIKPSLDAGKLVICDRFTDASFAYQGGGRGLSWERISQLRDWVQGELSPDMTLLLDIPVEIGLKRAGERSTPDRFEQESIAFFERVRSAYLRLAEEAPERFRIIDASLSIEEVHSQIAACLAEIMT